MNSVANAEAVKLTVARSRVSPELRYLKQVKARSGTLEFDATRVPVFALEKYDMHSVMRLGPLGVRGDEMNNFLGFRFVEFAEEQEHLEQDGVGTAAVSRSLMRRRSDIRAARKLAAAGDSSRVISVKLNIPKSTIQRYLAKR